MTTFLTELPMPRYAGANIEAENWEEAEKKSKEMDLVLLGRLDSEHLQPAQEPV